VQEAREGCLLVEGVAEWRMMSVKTQRPDATVRFVPPSAVSGASGASGAAGLSGDVPVRHVCEPIVPAPKELAPSSPPPASSPPPVVASSKGKEEKKGFWGWLGGEDKNSGNNNNNNDSVGRSRSTTTRAPLAKY
jgi:hypothetical protein